MYTRLLARFCLPAWLPLISACLTLSACSNALEVQDSSAESRQGAVGKADGLSQAPAEMSCGAPLKGHDPNGVHDLGEGKMFEGWYYRISDPARDESWVIITAFWRDSAGDERAFVELIEGSSGASYQRVFEGPEQGVDIAKISEQKGTFAFWIGEEDSLYLSADLISGRFRSDDGTLVDLELTVDGCAYWGDPRSSGDRWTMGWVTELPGPPLKWHVHHLKGLASGELSLNGQVTSFDRLPVHQEKNWGRAFPSRWVWFQSNSFEGRPDVAIAGAGGPIFAINGSPEGYMLGVRWQERFFSWRTQDGHVFKDVTFTVDHEQGLARWTMRVEGWLFRADVTITAPVSEFIPIYVPDEGGLALKAVEHLSAKLELELFERAAPGTEGVEELWWRKLDTVTSSLSAVEAGGSFAEDEGLLLGGH